MDSAVISFPRVGKLRELKFASEKYFNKEINSIQLNDIARSLRQEHWDFQKQFSIKYISSNDFSFYDNILDTAVLLNVIPKSYKDLKLDELDIYFAMARGYQGIAGDVPALAMKKWFNTNYHYIVPEIYDDIEIKLVGDKPFKEYIEAKMEGIITKPVIIGPLTFLKLIHYQGSKKINDYVNDIIKAYKNILLKFNELGTEWIQFDEPILVTDLSNEEIELFKLIYKEILECKNKTKVLLQTYFGDIRDCYADVINMEFDGIGLDFREGKKTKELVESFGFPKNKVLFAGLLNGKNIWKCNYGKILSEIELLKGYAENIVLSTSCSLLHVPYSLENEGNLKEDVKEYFSFALEKLKELKEITILTESLDYKNKEEFIKNKIIFDKKRLYQNSEVRNQVKNLSESDFIRTMERSERNKIQKNIFNLPILPTTTIGSFPQTLDVKKNRTRYKKGEINKEEYDKEIYAFIKECIAKQEQIGLDVLVHGEYERNDMVEFFGENLEGYVFTEKAWVQSYGTRCVKPPIIFGDVNRSNSITVEYSSYAQSLTEKPVKGMLTGPVTILNWSFPREDITLKEMAYQIAIAIRKEVLDLEKAGIRIIQIDEAALKEKLPLRKSDWYSEYLDWAIPAFRLCHSSVKAETQIHTHMCYSEFNDIIKDIDNMDADVITFESARSRLTILDAIKDSNFKTEVGPGVYDIHSPRVPSVDEIVIALKEILVKIDKNQLWVNPDCGLKTRGIEETNASLKNMVEAAKIIRSII